MRSRGVGSPALFGIALTSVGSAIYFVLGIVAGNALGLTPLVFLGAGVFFVLTMMTYVEGNSLHPERGGASTFARYAFDELWSFIAGWAIILDYLIVMAMAAVSISKYLAGFWGVAGDEGSELAIAAAAIAYVAWWNVRGISSVNLRFLLRLGLLNLAVLAALVIVGLLTTSSDVGAIADSIDLGSAPRWEDVIFASAVATVALTGIEAASGLASEIRVGRRELRELIVSGGATVLVVLVAVSVAALANVPVVDGHTALSDRYVEAPLLGVADALDPAGVSDALRYALAGVGALVLLTAVNGQMLGFSRLAYSLATNRQIPSPIGKLHKRHSTPYVAIAIASVAAFGLILSNDIRFLAGLFAFGAMLAFLLAHLSVIVLRFREPEEARERAFRVPWCVKVGRGSVPIPSALGALMAGAGWVSVLVLHSGARYVGSGWLLGGLVLYVVYRKTQGKSLTRRFTIPATALQEPPEVEYGSILVPVFGTPLDDDIVGTAGRLASEEGETGEGGAVIEALYVLEVPMSLPLDARMPEERVKAARKALARAKEVGEEYEGVEVATAIVRARSLGAGIVEEARRRGVDVIVLAAEQPSRVRGGALLGGRGGPRDKGVGEMTRYVFEKAPCRVILTAAPAGEAGTRAGVAP
ncbi:MAG: amino acid permease [Thermoleophilaceae bacterium]|nr:amino acid permease [Thermoleophilaceae bacterium]